MHPDLFITIAFVSLVAAFGLVGSAIALRARRRQRAGAEHADKALGGLFGSSRHEDFLARYVVREHARGRRLAEILDDPYLRNWSTPEERRRLLDLPEVVAALGENAVEELRRTVPVAAAAGDRRLR